MEARKIIDGYIGYIEEKGYAPKTIIRYRYILEIFHDYFTYTNTKKINEESIKDIDINDIFSAFEYYNNKYSYLSEHTARFYFVVIKEFLKYIKMATYLVNDDLVNSFGLLDDDENSYMYLTEQYVQRLLDQGLLRHGKGISPLTDDLIESLRKYCDKCMDDCTTDQLLIGSECYNRYIRALATKFMIFLGLKKSRIINMKIQDLDLTRGTIKIQKYVS